MGDDISNESDKDSLFCEAKQIHIASEFAQRMMNSTINTVSDSGNNGRVLMQLRWMELRVAGEPKTSKQSEA
ncbi:uncharacterized protein PHALS_14046 [Plasmopara halstedii]|uniref:Uncharacterized protein n=1 Tax=Plasmopara halstedii TaxID=4781 RepID=A0A0P1AR59_PLAHL|nr:uncharacterized protein PHALS_14046 [Plasmopara halstedii]CEG43754.1 hypothetical protein PHALS_14046 [Plasmopara halstedii]|eukprot:XP_024580123.1 hypothetical protein PHALS_14046 [Plasmopara halstedii]